MAGSGEYLLLPLWYPNGEQHLQVCQMPAEAVWYHPPCDGYGSPFTKEIEDGIIEALRPSWIQGLSILGGEPMEPENQAALLPFLRRMRRELPDKDIWLYTGYTFEAVSESELLPLVDVLVDGPFVEGERDISLSFRGSRNQRILTLSCGLPVKGREGSGL